MSNQKEWKNQFEEVSNHVSDWRGENKKASFNEIETKLDQQLAQLRAKMLSDLAEESELTDFKGLPSEERPTCPVCKRKLASNGQQKRIILTTHDEEIEIERSKGYCRHCRVSFFPPR